MSNQPDPVIQNVIDWCKEDNIDCVDDSSKNTTLSWLLTINKNVIIYKQPEQPDRIYIQSQINISKNHQEMITKWNQTKKNDLILKLQTLVAQFDANIQIIQEETTITKIVLSKVRFHSTISKAEFLELYVRTDTIHGTILNHLRHSLGLELQQSQAQQKHSDSDNPLAG